MSLSPYLANLRRKVGHELLLLPSVTVLPRDPLGRLLLVRERDSGAWGTIGGAVEPGESPQAAAVREAREEAGIDVVVGGIVAAVGGPEYEVEYSNGDRCAYVTVVFEAEILSGCPTPDGQETIGTAWFEAKDLADLDLSSFARALFRGMDLLP